MNTPYIVKMVLGEFVPAYLPWTVARGHQCKLTWIAMFSVQTICSLRNSTSSNQYMYREIDKYMSTSRTTFYSADILTCLTRSSMWFLIDEGLMLFLFPYWVQKYFDPRDRKESLLSNCVQAKWQRLFVRWDQAGAMLLDWHQTLCGNYSTE